MQGLFPFVGMEESQSVISRPPGEPAPPLLSGEGSFEGSLLEALGRVAGATKLSDAAARAGPARAGPPSREVPGEQRSFGALWSAAALGPGIWAEVVQLATSIQGNGAGVEQPAPPLTLRVVQERVLPAQPSDGQETAPAGVVLNPSSAEGESSGGLTPVQEALAAAFHLVTANSQSLREAVAEHVSPQPVLLPVEGYLDARGGELLLTLVASGQAGGTARTALPDTVAAWPLVQEPAAGTVPLQVTVQLPAPSPGEEMAGFDRQALSTLLQNIEEWQPVLERLGASEVKIVSLGQLQQEALAEGRPLPFQAVRVAESGVVLLRVPSAGPEVAPSALLLQETLPVESRADGGAASSAPTGVVPGSGKPVAFEAAFEGAASSAPTGVVPGSGKPVAFEAAFEGAASSAPTGVVPDSGKPVALVTAFEGAASSAPTGVVPDSGKPVAFEAAFEGAASSAPTGVVPDSGKPVALVTAFEGAASSAPTGVVPGSGKPVAFEAAFEGVASSASTGTVKPTPFSTVANVMGDAGAVNPPPAELPVDGTASNAGSVEVLSEASKASIRVPNDGSKAVFEAQSAQVALPAGGWTKAGTGQAQGNAAGIAQSEGVATTRASFGDARGWNGEIPVVDAPMQSPAFGEVSSPVYPVRLTEPESASDPSKVFPVSSTRAEALTGAGQAKSPVEASPVARDWQPVSEQISRQVQTALPEGRGEMQLRLEPPELGRLRLQVAVEDGRVTARFVTETRETHALLRSHLSELQSALSEAGLRVQEVKLTLAGGGDSATADSGGFGRGRQGLPQGFSQKAESGYGQPSSYAEEHPSPWEQQQPSLRRWESLLNLDGRSVDYRV